MCKTIMLFILMGLISCQSEQDNIKRPEVSKKEEQNQIITPLKYAAGFELSTQNNIQKLTIKNPFENYKIEQTYVLLKEDQLYKAENNEVILNVPIKKIIPFSTSYLSMIDTLGKLNSIVAVENKNYIYNPFLVDKINTKKVKTIGNINQLNIESVILSLPDLLVTIGAPGETSKQIQKIESAGIPFINNYDWQEAHPLGKAEWIKFFGALYNKNQEANAIFNSIESNYNQLKNKTKQNHPDVLFSSLYNGVWYIPGGKSYNSQFLKDASGTYPWKSDTTNGSLPLSFETVVNRQSNPDIWLSPNFNSINEIINSDDRYISFIKATEGRVFNQNKRMNKLGGNDYWEKGSLRPDLILKDYIELFKLDACNEDSLFFFSKLQP